MKARLLFLLALALPDLPLNPFRGALAPSLHHLLGTDDLGRDALLRLALASGRSLGFASACALLALALGLLLAFHGHRCRGALSALRSVPPLLFLLPLAAVWGGLSILAMGLLIGFLAAPQVEPALRSRLDSFRQSPAWAAERTLGATRLSTLRRWSPWGWQQMTALFPSVWLAALWSEATLSVLGLGPGPGRDSLGRLVAEELPHLATDATPLGWAALAMVLALAWKTTPSGPAVWSA